jgi:hypothetical protein
MITFLIILAFSGCVENTSQSDYENAIIGSWWFTQTINEQEVTSYYKFYENGTMKIDLEISELNLTEEQLKGLKDYWPILGEYIITEVNLSMKYPTNKGGKEPPMIGFDYKFLDNYSRLELTDPFDDKIILNKIENQ